MNPVRRQAAGLSRIRLLAILPILAVSLGLAGAVAGCGGSDAAMVTPGPAAAPTEAAVPMGSMTMPTEAEMSATWGARPGYVKQLPNAGQEAYRFALARPDVLQWLPCYCGCQGIPHKSNLDCFFQRREVQGNYRYEEHASYCDICIRTANLASKMLREGSTMVQIRAAVDSTFGDGRVPGTDTPLPPA